MNSVRRIRRAARLLVIDEHERLLLFRFTFAGRKAFWATAGGECDPGESFEDAARREQIGRASCRERVSLVV